MYLVGINVETCERDWEAACDWHAPYIFQWVPGLATVLRRALPEHEARDFYWFKLEEGDPLLQAARSRREFEHRDGYGPVSIYRDDILGRWDIHDPKTGAVDLA